MEAVRARGSAVCVEREATKVYMPPEGAPGFADAIARLVLGQSIAADRRGASLRSDAGRLRRACGVGAELLKRAGSARIVSIGSPTWANHNPLLSAAGLTIAMIPYYDAKTGGVDFRRDFLMRLRKARPDRRAASPWRLPQSDGRRSFNGRKLTRSSISPRSGGFSPLSTSLITASPAGWTTTLISFAEWPIACRNFSSPIPVRSISAFTASAPAP